MTVGILTYYRSHNYGALLQAVALRLAIGHLGHNAWFINYWPQHQKNIYRLFSWKEFNRGGFRGRLYYIKHFLKTLLPKLKRRYHFNIFYRNQILPYVKSPKSYFDTIVYGSDQIWRKQYWGYGYNPVYFGKNDFKANKHISYAASMGSLPQTEEDIDTVGDYVKNLQVVSVREKELQCFLKHQYSIDSSHNIDPTFLLSKEEWSNLIGKEPIINKPYLLLYDLQNVFKLQIVEAFAEKHHLEVIRLSGAADTMPTSKERNTDGPFEFLNLVYNANYVVTSSFHGLAFSLIFQKPFASSLIVNKSRVESLLSSVGLSDRLIANPDSLLDVSFADIDWAMVEHCIDEQKQSAYKYLHDALS